MADIRRIDCHVHYTASDVTPDEWRRRAEGQQGMMRASLQRPAWRDLNVLTEVMDVTHVDLGVIMPNHVMWPELRGRSSAQAYEDYNRSLSRDLQESGFGQRYVAMAVVDPFGDREDIVQLERSLQLPHIGGIGLIASYGNVTLDDPRFEPIYAVAQEHDVPITVHPGLAWPSWFDALRLRESNFLMSGLGFFLSDAMAIFMMAHGGVFDRFPGVRFMFCQLGGCAAMCCSRWYSAGVYALADQPPDAEQPPWTKHTLSDILSHLWLDMHTQDRHAIRLVMAEAGDHGLVLGGDYPVTMPDLGLDYAMAEIQSLGLTPEVQRKLERDNALALLGKGFAPE
ncbi:MAG TPA: amidohydrolase family protein [Chloroflexota bacterium]|nr:amidohydrolase family protein [Chloroflexota bacterium]